MVVRDILIKSRARLVIALLVTDPQVVVVVDLAQHLYRTLYIAVTDRLIN